MILHVAALLIAQMNFAGALASVVRDGAQLYSVHCSSCHGAHMEGSAQAPPLVNVNAGDVDFELSTGRMPAEAPNTQQFHHAPSFPPNKIAAIVAYVMTRSSGDKRLPQVVPGNIASGRRVFEENCQQCHAATGHGDNVGYRNVAPSLMDTAPQQIAEAVRMGPDVMPRFGPKVIDDAALGDVIAYVQYLQHFQYNPGGLQLANLGPVAEGFIAWTAGIGLLVLFVRRIGTTD